jgi:hypothetical protein
MQRRGSAANELSKSASGNLNVKPKSSRILGNRKWSGEDSTNFREKTSAKQVSAGNEFSKRGGRPSTYGTGKTCQQ